jgi:DNA-binding winged helix-turn-helix (wHTH) protein/tetratricopeptide (TPR) repeat protein
MTLPRSRLLTRLLASEARVVRLSAPAGYGKSSLARLFARQFEHYAICDCTNVSDLVDFAARALSALAGESQGSGDSAALTRLRLHAIEADEATWSRSILGAWKGRQERSLFILEHGEAIEGAGPIMALLGDLLATRPAERVVLISSRVALPLRASHYLAPNQILTLSREELRFNAEEAASIFEGCDVPPTIVDRMVRLADGWPSVLLLLALFVQYDANIETLIERLERVARADMHEHLVHEVLTAFTPDMMSTLLAMAAIPNATLDDIAAATGIRHATPIIDRLLHLPGFISSESGAYQVHPLVLKTLRSSHGADLADDLLRAAQEYERAGEFLRAAELYTACANAHAAAGALDRLPAALFQQPPTRLIDALTKIEMSSLCAYPNLWIAALPWRRQNVDSAHLYDEGSQLQAASGDSISLQKRLRVRLAMLAQEIGRLAEARALVEACKGRSSLDESPEERRLLLMTSAVIAAKQGRFAEADQFADEADAVQIARNGRFEPERGLVAMEKARLFGDWLGALKLSEEALYAAQRNGVISRIATAARAVAWSAWYCNDDALVTAANEMLEACGSSEVSAFARSVQAALSPFSADAPTADPALHVARWHAALITTNAGQAEDLFDQAIRGIDTTENVFLQIMMRASAALLLPTQRRRLLEARVIAQRIESPPLQASLELLIDSPRPSDYGIFKYMAARVARSPLKVRQDILYVDVVRGRVRRGSELVHVSDRGFELLVALALMPNGTSKEALASAIWPGLDVEAALNALKMCVSRTRVQIADRDAIQSTKRGYSLGERVAIDVHEFERLLRSIRGVEAFGDPIRRQLQEAAGSLGAREREYAGSWAWFAPCATHLDELQRELTLLLTKDAFKRDQVPPTSVTHASQQVVTAGLIDDN